jgi:signal transduction histidine kinase
VIIVRFYSVFCSLFILNLICTMHGPTAWLSTFWHCLGGYGVRGSYAPKLANDIGFVNHAAFLAFLVTAPSIPVIHFFFGDPSLTAFSVGLALNYLLVPLFNQLGWHAVAKIELFLVPIVNTFFASSVFGYEGNTHFLYILIVFATVLTFDKSETKRLVVVVASIGLSLAGLVATDFSLFLYQGLTPGLQRVISWVVVYFGLVGGMTVAYFYIHKFTRQARLVEQANSLLQAKFDESQKLNAELNRFVYSISLDLGAPLASVQGLVYLGQQSADLAEAQLYFDLQGKSLHKLNQFIADILDYSRNNRTELQVQAVDFGAELAQVLALQAQYGQGQPVVASTEVEQKTSFMTDRHRLWVVLNNLVSNAYRYRNTNQAESWLKIGVQVGPAQATITVADNGIGIAAEHLPRIFDMFFRATDQATGSGLGLYIVKEVVGKLQGSIRVESTVAQGTVFTIQLPNLAG